MKTEKKEKYKNKIERDRKRVEAEPIKTGRRKMAEFLSEGRGGKE